MKGKSRLDVECFRVKGVMDIFAKLDEGERRPEDDKQTTPSLLLKPSSDENAEGAEEKGRS